MDYQEFWPSLKRSRPDFKRRLIPIVGNSVFDEIIDKNRFLGEIKSEWIKSTHFPWNNKQQLSSVAQYFAMTEGDEETRLQYIRLLKNQIFKLAQEEIKTGNVSEAQFCQYKKLDEHDQQYSFTELARDLGFLNFNSKRLINSSLASIARLRSEVFITTSHFRFLEIALEYEGKNPISLNLVNLLDEQGFDVSASKLAKGSENEPLVFHIFGHDYDKVDSEVSIDIVLTDSDYLQLLKDLFRTRVTPGNTEPATFYITTLVERLQSSPLLLLGYDVYSWEFRVLIHGLLPIEVQDKKNPDNSICVQFKTTKKDVINVQRALKRYLQRNGLELFWGQPKDALDKLHDNN